MGRIARNKVRKAFACNKEGSEEFAKLLDEYSHEIEMYAAYEEFINGKDFKRMDPEKRMSAICTLLT